MRRNEKNLPADATISPDHLDRNPGVALVWTTRRYRPWRQERGDGLFYIGEPVRAEWFAHGRPATRDEVLASIESGLPSLVEVAAIEGPSALRALNDMTSDAMRHLPVAA